MRMGRTFVRPLVMCAARWCSGLTYLPVTEEIVGSNPIRVASISKLAIEDCRTQSSFFS